MGIWERRLGRFDEDGGREEYPHFFRTIPAGSVVKSSGSDVEFTLTKDSTVEEVCREFHMEQRRRGITNNPENGLDDIREVESGVFVLDIGR